MPVRVKIELLLVKAGGNLQGNYVCTILFLFQLWQDVQKLYHVSTEQVNDDMLHGKLNLWCCMNLNIIKSKAEVVYT